MMLCGLTLVVLSVAPGGNGKCEERCNERQASCAGKCTGSDRCLRQCGERSSECLAVCHPAKSQQSMPEGRKEPMPCGMNPDRSLRPCTEKELKRNKDALQRAPAGMICTDRWGNETVCEDTANKAMDTPQMKKAKSQAEECAKSGGDASRCPAGMQESLHKLQEQGVLHPGQ